MKAQKSAVIAASTSANTAAGSATIATIAGRTRSVIGCWNSLFAYPTAAQSFGGYINIASNAAGWLTQKIPTSILASGLSTQIDPFCQPVVSLPEDFRKYIDGAYYIPWFEHFPVGTKQDFVFTNYMDGTNTVAGAGRYGLIWLE